MGRKVTKYPSSYVKSSAESRSGAGLEVFTIRFQKTSKIDFGSLDNELRNNGIVTYWVFNRQSNCWQFISRSEDVNSIEDILNSNKVKYTVKSA